MDPLGKAGDLEALIATATPEYSGCAKTEDDLCMIMYSSGTTGTPKGVMFNHGQYHFINAGAAGMGGASQAMVSLIILPLFHIGGLIAYTMIALGFGGTAVIARTFEPGIALATFSDPSLGITHFLGVPQRDAGAC
jgi:fatty-acyl-CoA synthase